MSSPQSRQIRTLAPWMAISLAIVAALALMASRAVAQAPEPVPVPAPPESVPAPLVDQVDQVGRVQCVVFAGNRMAQLSGATVTISSGEAAVTDRRGSAFLSAPPGKHTMRIEIPAEQLPAPPKDGAPGVAFELVDVPVVAADVTRVLLTLSAQGELVAADVRPPARAADAAAPEQPQAPEATGAAPAPSGPTGSITGRVTSSEGGAPIAGAKVYVLGQPAEAQTGADGRFAVTVPPGSHTLSVVHIDYTGQTLEGVSVSAGVESQLDVQLAPAPVDMEDYLVKGRRIRGSIATVMEERREAASVTDAIGAEDISRSPDSTASAATRRIVGATVVGGQFLFVRGLGGRYTNVRLNGVPMPSTDPDLPGFQLDLFPASMLSALNIVKTFTPDIPGDFAGGSMNVVTRDYPEKLSVTTSLGTSSNTETLGRDVLTYDGGDLDWLGVDDGTRALPDSVPDQRLDTGRTSELTAEDVERVSRDFPVVWEPDQRTGLPNLSLGFSLGNTSQAWGRPLGYLITLGYRYQLKRFNEDVGRYDPGQAHNHEEHEREASKEEASFGALGTVSYALAEGHDLSLVSMFTQNGEDNASVTEGFTLSESMVIRKTQFRFLERRLFFNQLIGHHDLDALMLDWQVNASTVARNQPDTRNLAYQQSPDGQFTFRTDPGSGERLYTELSMLDLGGGLDVTVPIDKTKLKAGYLGRTGDRDFTARRFAADLESGPDVDLSLPPNELFAADNVGTTFMYREGTGPTDGYEAQEDLHAGYAMVDAGVLDWLRLTGGARVEAFHQAVDSASPFARMSDDDPESADRSETDVLPAAGIVFGLSDGMSIRTAYGGTVARPLVRELSPFANYDYVRRRAVFGNPELVRTYVHNFDLRWELFPSEKEVFAVSGFYKIFQQPIENIIIDDAGDLRPENVEGAQNFGFELEARFGLDRLAADLEPFSVSANFAWIHSRVTLSTEQALLATSKNRPMAGQSPYVANLSLGYSEGDTGLSLDLFYNVFGKRILEVGRSGYPDVYEQPIHSVDMTASYRFTKQLKVGASGTNLLRQPIPVEQGDSTFSRKQEGIGFGVSVAYAN